MDATTTVEVIQEFAHVWSRRRTRTRTRAQAAALARDYAELLAPLAAVGETDLLNGLALFERDEAVGAFDAVLAATAITAKADALVSADRAFGAVRDLRHVVPDAGGVASLLNP